MGRQPAPETRRKRRRMVASQLAARGIRDGRVLATMAWLPREWFLPPHLADEAYDDAPLPIGNGQTISQPFIVALMTEALAPRRGDRVLEIGTGSGYQTAVLAHLGARVYTVERLPDLLVEAEERFRRLGLRGIETRLGDGAASRPAARRARVDAGRRRGGAGARHGDPRHRDPAVHQNAEPVAGAGAR